MNDNLKVLILTCATGEGHNSAARAIEAELINRGIECEVKDTYSFKGEKAQKRVSSRYTTIITRFPLFFGFLYKIGGLYDSLRLPSPVYAMNACYAGKLNAYIIENKFNCVICTHLYAMEAMTAVREEYCNRVKTYGVLTDYTAIPFYKDTSLDGYFVSDERVKNMLVKKGISAEIIFCTGIPVHPKFNTVYCKRELRERLNIPADKKFVAVMTGGAGCGKIVRLCKKFDRATDGSFYIAVFAGRNEQLRKKLEKRFAGNEKFAVMPFTSQMDLYIKAADVAVTKPGGLSSTELAVCNIPIVHLHSVPGVETYNLKYFAGNGLSLKSKTTAEAVKNTLKLLGDGACAGAMRAIQKFFINAYAVDGIAGKIEEDRASERIFTATVHNGRISYGQYSVQQNYSEVYDAARYL